MYSLRNLSRTSGFFWVTGRPKWGEILSEICRPSLSTAHATIHKADWSDTRGPSLNKHPKVCTPILWMNGSTSNSSGSTFTMQNTYVRYCMHVWQITSYEANHRPIYGHIGQWVEHGAQREAIFLKLDLFAARIAIVYFAIEISRQSTVSSFLWLIFLAIFDVKHTVLWQLDK